MILAGNPWLASGRCGSQHLLHGIVLYCIVLHCIVLHCIVWYVILTVIQLHCTVLHAIALLADTDKYLIIFFSFFVCLHKIIIISIFQFFVCLHKIATHQPCGCARVGEVARGSGEAEAHLFVFVVAFVFVFVFVFVFAFAFVFVFVFVFEFRPPPALCPGNLFCAELLQDQPPLGQAVGATGSLPLQPEQ